MCVGPCGEVFAAAAKLNEFSSGKKKSRTRAQKQEYQLNTENSDWQGLQGFLLIWAESVQVLQRKPQSRSFWTAERSWCGNLLTYILGPTASSKTSAPTEPVAAPQSDRWHLHRAQGTVQTPPRITEPARELLLSSLPLSRLQHPALTWDNIPECISATSKMSPASALLLIGQQRGEVSKRAC